MAVPQFGEPEPGRDYPDRPAAFAIVADGGLDPEEPPQEAAARECGEEAGLVVEVGEPVTRADHYFVNEKGESRNTRGSFYEARLVRVEPSLKIEDDHALVWAEPYEALRLLDRESHVWAVTAWLRRNR